MTITAASLILFGSALAASAFEWSAGGRADGATNPKATADGVGAISSHSGSPSVDPQRSWSAGGRADSAKWRAPAQVKLRESDPSVDPQLTYWKHHAQRYRQRWLYALKKRDQWKRLAKRLRASRTSASGFAPGRRRDSPASVKRTIRSVFGGYGSQAVAVADCETGGTFSVWAGYGKHQYWGLFQMGPSERARYGHGWDAWTQSRAAYRYFVDSGRDWSPWSCKP